MNIIYKNSIRGGRGTGTAVPAKSVSPGSVSPRFRSPGLSPESQSPGSLSPQFLSPVPTFEFFSPRPRSPIFKFVSPSLSPVPDFRNLCPRPCPRSPIFEICVPVPVPGPKFSQFLSPSLSPNSLSPNSQNFDSLPCSRSLYSISQCGDSTIRNRPMSESFLGEI